MFASSDYGRQVNSVLLVGISAFVVYTMAPRVAHAYALQLAGPQVPTQRFVALGPTGSGMSLRKGKARVNDAAPLNGSFLSHMTQSALQHPSRGLWVMYPASVRGRAFGGTGSDPLISGTGTGW